MVLEYKISEKEDFGRLLKQVRKEMGLTQEEVSNFMRTSKSNVSAIENGKNITMNTFVSYLEALEATIDIKINYK